MNAPPQALFLSGPTAVGKSAVALRLAEGFRGEIVSVDSMQVYRGLDVGTAKPGHAERARTPHHLIDVADLTESFDAARFVSLAREACAEIVSRGMRPLFCGGTAMYFQAFLQGLGMGAAPDAAFRARLEVMDLTTLVMELSTLDSEAPRLVDVRNTRRVIRAIELIRASGRPLREARTGWSRGPGLGARVVVLRRAPADLRVRIERRVSEMFDRGLVDETRRLLARGLRQNRTAMQAIGYRQVVEYLDGLGSMEEAMERTRARTWQYARRQMSWFRTQWDSVWLDVEEAESADSVARRAAVFFGIA